MPSKTATKEHCAIGVIPAAAWRVRAVSTLPQWQLAITFNDGTTGIVDMASLVNSADAGVFDELRNQDIFNQVFLDYGAVTWPNGADLAPDMMYDEIRSNGRWIVT